MSEQNQGPIEAGKLTPEQQEVYRADLKIMLDPGSIAAADPEEVQTIKAEALAELAHGLADRETAQGLSDLIVEDAESGQRDSIPHLYAYWLMAKTATEQDPDAKLPAGFIDHVRELAEKHEENDIILGLMEMGADEAVALDATPPDERDFSSYDSVFTDLRERASGCTQELHKRSEEAWARLSDAQVSTSSHLHEHAGASDEHAGDLERFEENSHDPESLLRDLKNGKFLTEEGLAAARAQQDRGRLELGSHDPEILLRDLRNHRFLTEEGRAAAEAQQDRIRLELASHDPESLLRDSRNSRFLTPEGLTAAEAQQDKMRLELGSHDPEALLKDLLNSRFLTPEGLMAAEVQQDKTRLELHRHDGDALHRELSNGRFITREGQAEARRILGIVSDSE